MSFRRNLTAAMDRLVEMGLTGSGPAALTLHANPRATMEDLQAASDARARAINALSGGLVMVAAEQSAPGSTKPPPEKPEPEE